MTDDGGQRTEGGGGKREARTVEPVPCEEKEDGRWKKKTEYPLYYTGVGANSL
jgi:hypothetical protein